MWRLGYLLYGAVLLGLLGTAEYRGWSMTPVSRISNVPRSVRNNPGAYRPVYGASPRYRGGK
jgi:hypothetical protein